MNLLLLEPPGESPGVKAGVSKLRWVLVQDADSRAPTLDLWCKDLWVRAGICLLTISAGDSSAQSGGH